MRKIVMVALIGLVGVVWGTTPVEAYEVQKQEIFSIENPTWITKSGMSKGELHDRQALGFILREGTTLKVRQANPSYQGRLTVRLLGDDSKKEKSVEVSNSWKTIRATSPLVPFVDTPYDTTSGILEYSIESSQEQKKLPTYVEKDNEKQFFQEWTSENSEYALIKGNDFQLLLPKKDQKLASNLKDFASLNELIAYYHTLFARYNQMAGIDESTPTNRNGANRYFLKADASGIGGAYYGSKWTANSYNTADMWLKKLTWGTLHEIAHGYQAGFDGQGMYTGEVSNNLFGTQMQYESYGSEVADKKGWLFNEGKKVSVEKKLYQKMVVEKGTYESVELREKLILLTMLKQKAGEDAFVKMYQGYRKEASQEGFNENNYPLPELLNHYYSETSQQDFTPVLTNWGLELTSSQAEINRAKGYPAVASLADVVPESELARARQQIDSNLLITSNFEMVKSSELAFLGLKGNLTLTLKGEALNALEGEKVSLKDGHQMIQERTVTDGKIVFSQVPNGVYSLWFNGAAMKQYTPITQYVYVKEAENQVDIELEKLSVSNLVNQKISFLGLGDGLFGEVLTDLNKHKGTFKLTDDTPHAYFAGKTYATVKVTTPTGKVQYEKIIQGTNQAVIQEDFPLSVGDQINIYHAESEDRLFSSEALVDTTQTTNTWFVTKNGLENQQLKNNPEHDLLKKINLKGDFLLQSKELVAIPFNQSSEKKNLWVAIQSLPSTLKKEYEVKYGLLFSQEEISEPENQGEFHYSFKGLGNHEFATMEVSLSKMEAIVKTNSKKPHWYFDEAYASIQIHDEAGKEKYAKTYHGRTNYPAALENLSLEIGDTITTMHREFDDRLIVQNQQTKEPLKIMETTTYQVTKNGLQLVGN